MKESNNLTRSATYAFIKGAVTFLFTLGLYKLTALFVKMQTVVGGEQSTFKDIPNLAVYATVAVALFLIFNSITTALSAYDRDARCEFILRLEESGAHEIGFTGELASIIKDGLIWLEAAFTLLPMLLASLFGAFAELPRIFFPEGDMDGGLLPAVIIIPLCLVIFLLSKYEARRYWLKLWRENQLKKLDTGWRLFLRIAILTVMYPTVYPLAPLLIFAAISLGAIVAELTDALTVLGLILAVALLIGAVYGIKLLSAMRRRRKFLRQLKALCRESGITLSEIKNPYRSFVSEVNDCSFTLSYGEESFDCVVVSTLSRGVPFVFTSATGGYFRHRLGTANHFIGFSHHTSFFHSGEGRKIVIVDPAPKEIFIEDLGTVKAIIPWDSIFGFTVHDAVSFLGGLGRRCLGKYEPKYH